MFLSFALYPLPSTNSYLHPLLNCSSPPFPHSPHPLLSKTTSIYIQIAIHLSYRLFIYIIFALIYTSFKLSFFFFMNFYSSFATSAITPITSFHKQTVLLNCRFIHIIPPHIVWVLSRTLTEPLNFLAL